MPTPQVADIHHKSRDLAGSIRVTGVVTSSWTLAILAEALCMLPKRHDFANLKP
ncbi:hypothetical protein LZ32DRAFT_27151 [Colletotrichum eremochloae]|nr:hypothetical protein LZ32DRAFT_27151 [Colletotrichum eremochloae]